MTLIRGAPGSGKSSLAKLFSSSSQGFIEHYEADMFWYNDKGEYVFDISRIREAHLWCQQKVFDTLTASKAVVVSNTFTKASEMEEYFVIAKEFDIIPQVITCQGNYKNIHNAPEDVLEKMKNRFELNIDKLWEMLK